MSNIVSTFFENGTTSDTINIYLADELIAYFENTNISEFLYDGILYRVQHNVLEKGIEIIISTDAEDNQIDFFDIQLVENENVLCRTKIAYVPTVPYTNTASSIFFGLTSDNIVPMFDIEDTDKVNNYDRDDLIAYKHYLDLSSLQYITNEEERKSIKEARKQARKGSEPLSLVASIPSKQKSLLDFDKRIEAFIALSQEKKDISIPVFLWGIEDHKLENLKFFYESLHSVYQNGLAIRVVNIYSFMMNIDKIHDVSKSFIILLDWSLDYVGDIDSIKEILKQSFAYFSDITFLMPHFTPQTISISSDNANINYIHKNVPISIYFSLFKEFPALKYGDYCGYDRKTLSSMIKGGKPTARIVLAALSKDDYILVHRSWDPKDKIVSAIGTSIGVSRSMSQLLKKLQDGKFDYVDNIKFVDENICDADISLKAFYPKNTTPGIIKTLCLRHNVISVKLNYID